MNDDARVLAREILEIVPLVMRTVSAEMRHTRHQTIAAHFRLLWILEHYPRSLSELAETQSVSLPTMSNSVTSLEERGWVERRRSNDDRRRVMIHLTPVGQEVLAQVREQMEIRVEKVTQTLDPQQRHIVSEALFILKDGFEAFSEAECKCREGQKRG